MKQFTSVSTLLLVILAVYWSFYALMPVYRPDANLAESSFSTDRALRHVEQMAAAPHGLGFPAHEKVKRYIMAQLGAMGLEVTLQEDYSLGIGGGDLSRPSNILARIKGSGSGKALLLLSHYDSDPHAAMGASDAASGVATIMEGIRAFWSEGILPENDIIILLTDSEEQDLNGAKLFVNHHPWAREIGLVLNFEARGSGGPGIMLIETNRVTKNSLKNLLPPIRITPWQTPWHTAFIKCCRMIPISRFSGKTGILMVLILPLSMIIMTTIQPGIPMTG